MNRRLWLVVSGGGLVAVTAAAWLLWPKSTTPPAEPTPVQYSALPKAVFRRGEHVGERVRVAFYRPLLPTADPLVWHFHPGEPAAVVPATYRVHFDTPPRFDSPPVVVVGTVEGLEADLLKRPNGVPGLVVLRGCSAIPLDSQ